MYQESGYVWDIDHSQWKYRQTRMWFEYVSAKDVLKTQKKWTHVLKIGNSAHGMNFT